MPRELMYTLTYLVSLAVHFDGHGKSSAFFSLFCILLPLSPAPLFLINIFFVCVDRNH
jgi:hypothetical protein